jgi:hypothetical protein
VREERPPRSRLEETALTVVAVQGKRSGWLDARPSFQTDGWVQ